MKNKVSFEMKLEQLNQLVKKLQDENIPFEESLKVYQDALKLSEELKTDLNNAISSINVISENNEKEKFSN